MAAAVANLTLIASPGSVQSGAEGLGRALRALPSLLPVAPSLWKRLLALAGHWLTASLALLGSDRLGSSPGWPTQLKAVSRPSF
jgi:hypothetical protein